MKEYFGITVPMLYYQNHGPFRYWYDADKNTLCSDCGVEITVNLSEDEFTKKELRKLIRQLDAALLFCFLSHGIIPFLSVLQLRHSSLPHRTAVASSDSRG